MIETLLCERDRAQTSQQQHAPKNYMRRCQNLLRQHLTRWIGCSLIRAVERLMRLLPVPANGLFQIDHQIASSQHLPCSHSDVSKRAPRCWSSAKTSNTFRSAAPRQAVRMCMQCHQSSLTCNYIMHHEVECCATKLLDDAARCIMKTFPEVARKRGTTL